MGTDSPLSFEIDDERVQAVRLAVRGVVQKALDVEEENDVFFAMVQELTLLAIAGGCSSGVLRVLVGKSYEEQLETRETN